MGKGHIATKEYNDFINERRRLELRGYTYRGLLEQPREDILTIDLYGRDGVKVQGKTAYFTKDKEPIEVGARLPSEVLKESSDIFGKALLQYSFSGDAPEKIFLSKSDLEILAQMEEGARMRLDIFDPREDAFWKLRRDGLIALVREHDMEFHIVPQALSGEYVAKK